MSCQDKFCGGEELWRKAVTQALIPTDGIEPHQFGLLAISLCLSDGSLLSGSDAGDVCIIMGGSWVTGEGAAVKVWCSSWVPEPLGLQPLDLCI